MLGWHVFVSQRACLIGNFLYEYSTYLSIRQVVV